MQPSRRGVSLQAYKHNGSGAVPIAYNVRITKSTWDPQQPGQHVGGILQLPCAHGNCATFIGDYFGLAMSAGNVYGFFVSRRTARQASPPTREAPSTTSSRCWRRCRGAALTSDVTRREEGAAAFPRREEEA